MTHRIIDKQVNIYQFPKECEESLGSVTLGDLHGNALKLIHALLNNNVIQLQEGAEESKEDIYNGFANLYEETRQLCKGYQAFCKKREEEKLEFEEKNDQGDLDPESQIAEWLQRFNTFMGKMKVTNPDTLLRLIGDELADRGSNDYFTLRILHFLKQNHVKVNILISNHSDEFITAYERLNTGKAFQARQEISDRQKPSIVGLIALLETGQVTHEEIQDLINSSYKPTLKAIDYTLTEDGIRLFSHAPIRFEAINQIAHFLGVFYDDSSKEGLAATIDKINVKFQQAVQENRVHELCEFTGSKPDEDQLVVDGTNMKPHQFKNQPLVYSIWNRWNAIKDEDEDARPQSKNGYNIYYVHGHDPFVSERDHVTNVDTNCGKKSFSEQIEYEMSALEGLFTQRDDAINRIQRNIDQCQAKLRQALESVEILQEELNTLLNQKNKTTNHFQEIIDQQHNKCRNLSNRELFSEPFKALNSDEQPLANQEHDPQVIDEQFLQKNAEVEPAGLLGGENRAFVYIQDEEIQSIKQQEARIKAKAQAKKEGLFKGGVLGLLAGATIGLALVVLSITPFGPTALGIALFVTAVAFGTSGLLSTIGWIAPSFFEITEDPVLELGENQEPVVFHGRFNRLMDLEAKGEENDRKFEQDDEPFKECVPLDILPSIKVVTNENNEPSFSL